MPKVAFLVVSLPSQCHSFPFLNIFMQLSSIHLCFCSKHFSIQVNFGVSWGRLVENCFTV